MRGACIGAASVVAAIMLGSISPTSSAQDASTDVRTFRRLCGRVGVGVMTMRRDRKGYESSKFVGQKNVKLTLFRDAETCCEGAAVAETWSSGGGRFKFATVPSGTYWLMADDGQGTHKIKIAIGDSGPRECDVDFAMRCSEIELWETVEVD